MNPKRILSFVAFNFVCATILVRVAGASAPGLTPLVNFSDQGVTVTLATPSLQLTDVTLEGQSFRSIAIESDAIAGQVGGPAIPVTTRMVEIPRGMDPALSYSVGRTETIEQVKLAPIPRSSFDNSQTHQNLIRQEFYEDDNLIPEEAVSLSAPFDIGGKRYALLTISPCQYNPARQTLLVHSDLTASVQFVPSPVTPQKQKFDEPVWRELSAAIDGDPSRDDVAVRTDNLGHLVIVVPNTDAYANSMAPLIAWKKRMGYVVTVVRMVRDVQNSEAALKGYLQTAWEEWEFPPTHVILVGDASQMPTFRDGEAENVSWYVSDNQYVTYGYNEGEDIAGWIPSSFIGRLPAQNAQEAAQMVTKIVGYESAPFVQQDWVEGGVLIAAGVHSSIQTNQAVGEMMLEYGYQRNQIQEAYAEYHAGQPIVDPAIMNNGVNGGVGFVNFRGYQLWGGRDIPEVVTQVRALRNGWKLPIITGMVCETNDYANRFGGESVGEAWLRAYNNNVPCGAVACFGPADRRTHTWFNNTMNGEFYRLLFRRGVHTLGALALGSKLSLLRNYPSLLQLANGESVGYYFFTYTVFGDPSMQVRTREPQEMSVTFEENLPVGSTNMIVSVLDIDDTPVVGAYVHYLGDEDHRYGAYTDDNGEALFEVPPLEEGTLLLTVTATNFIPFLGETGVAAVSRFASLSGIQFSDDNEGDSRGNNDGMLNPGELIELTVTLANRGSDELQDMRATLESPSPFVQIPRGSADFGSVEQDAAAESDAPYLIEIMPETPSGAKIDFELNVSSGEDEFLITFSREVIGYDFVVAGFATVEQEPLTPGTTRRLVVSLENVGVLSSAELLGTLYCSDRTIQIREAEARFDAIEAGESGDNVRHPFEVMAGPNAYQGGTVNFGLLLVDEMGLRDSVVFTMTLGDPAVNSPQGPDDYGYWAIDNRDTTTGLEPTYERLQGATNLNLNDANDNASPTGIGGAVRVIDLPFPFVFYGERYRRATVSTNGWLAFGEWMSISWNNQELGSGLAPAAMIAPWWEDLYDGSVLTRFDEDNSRFIIEWRNFGSVAGRLNFSVVLYDPTVAVTATGDGEIVINYTEIPQQRDFPGDEAVTIGIASHDSKTALTVRHARSSDLRTGLLRSGIAVKFTTGESQELGSLEGRVTDAGSGAPMAGVRVMLDGTGFFSMTDEGGNYSIAGAAVGMYSALAHKRYFNDDVEADVEIRLDEVAAIDFSLTHPTFRIDIEEINVVVPPDSIRYRNFQVSNDGNGQLDFELILNIVPQEPERDTAWGVQFDWDVTAVTGEQTVRGVAADDEFFYFSGQRQRAVYPHPIYVLNKFGESIREFDQIPVDSAARGYAGMDFNGENLVAVEERSLVELTTEGGFVRSIVSPERQNSFSVAYAPSRATYFTKGVTGSTIYEIDPEGNLIGQHRTPENSFRTYGFAWFPADPDSFNLYVLRVPQENGLTELYRMNPANDEWRFVRALDLPEGDVPQDMLLTKRYDPLIWTIAVLVSRQEGDHLIGYELAPNTTWIHYDPPAGSVQPGEAQDFTIEFKSEDMPRGEYHVVLELLHNAEGEVFEIPVTFIVGDEVAVAEIDFTPSTVSLNSLYPNPFNSMARATFTIPKAGPVNLILYDALGRELQRQSLGKIEAGRHSVTFDGEGLSSGIYLIRLETAAGSTSQKMVLMR